MYYSLQFYQLPAEWKDKRMEQELEKEAYIIKTTNQILDLRKKQTKAQEDSDEDDLVGWHK